MKRVAVLCFENPYTKPNDGAKNDMRTRIEALKLNGDCAIDVYAFNKPEEAPAAIEPSAYGIRHLYQYQVQPFSAKGLLSGLPISVYKRFTPECVEELKHHSYDAIIYEGEHMSPYRLKDATHAKKHILRQHDIESAYRRELARSAPSRKYAAAQMLEANLYSRLERDIDRYFDAALFISKTEKEIFDRQYPNTGCKFLFMPPATEKFAEGPVIGEKEKEILYFGNMELQNNLLSILWFAEQVFPRIRKSGGNVRLKIIGKISEENREKLLNIAPDIEIIGYVEDLTEEINRAAIIASPVLYGAGVKVKVIDALSYGQIVCATSKTIEGTELVPGIHLIVEDDPDQLANHCCRILKNRAAYVGMAQEGLSFVKANHSIKAQAEMLRQVLK